MHAAADQSKRAVTVRIVFAAVAVVVCSVVCSAPSQASQCSFSSISNIAFGNYNVYNASTTLSNGTMVVSCSAGVPNGGLSVTISLNRGVNSTSFPNRYLASGSALLSYNIYQNAALTVIWGDGTGGTQTSTVTIASTSSPVTLTMYGSIPAGQDVTVGSYSDTITATLTY
jgi:spore coat protein U-like protein